MKCARCSKTLTKYAVSIDTRNGPIGWGPTCAKYVTVTATRAYPYTRQAEVRRPVSRVVAADERQLELGLETA